MTHFPITVPTALATAFDLDPEADDWGQAARHAVGTANGETYVLSGLWRHVPYRATGPERDRGFVCQLITRHAPDGTTLATAVIADETPGGGAPSAIRRGGEGNLTLLPDGAPVLSSKPGNTYLLTPELDRLQAAWQMDERPGWSDEPQTDDPFAATVAVTPGGRLLCLTSEHRLENWGYPRGNLIAVSEPGAVLAPGRKPELRALATLKTETKRQTENDAIAHVRFGDAPVLGDHRPAPSLADTLYARHGSSRFRRDGSFLHRPVPLADDLYVVPVFGGTYRSGSRGQAFSFALMDDRGTVRGELGGLDLHAHSPYNGAHYRVAADPHRGTAFHLNRYGLYAWTADGTLRALIGTDRAPFKALATLELLTATPTGDLLLFHPKHHLVLRVPVPADLAELPAAVAAVLAGLAKGRNALKKRHAPLAWLWLDTAGAVHHL
ncbi:hypothetical protein ACIRBX_22985 [Kitasatospora sp. NPDC096147]|uniref:hypothetical protein n=1 Tax=Kitasatospora sp. NPDC096147 TaxID=3364093 RepID=UPI0037F562B9